jgi:hypothetical protein
MAATIKVKDKSTKTSSQYKADERSYAQKEVSALRAMLRSMPIKRKQDLETLQPNLSNKTNHS